MGRYEQENSRPYPEFGNTRAGRFLLAILGWFHEKFIAPLAEFFAYSTGMTREHSHSRRTRTRRWLICWAMGALVLIITAGITAGVMAENQRDFQLTQSQTRDQGTLVAEDFSACVMDIELRGQPLTANTACNQRHVFPAGTRISLVQDPSDPTRFLAVAPGQDWEPDPIGTIIAGTLIGVLVAGFTIALGHHFLLRNTKPELPARKSSPQEQVRTQEKPAFTAALEDVDSSWDRKKHQLANKWTNLTEMNILVRASLLALVLVAVSIVAIIFGAASTVEVSRDRQLVRSEPIVNTVLLEIGGRDDNAKVQLGINVLELQYGLRFELFRSKGQDIPVVQDPLDQKRLIPTEIDDLRGLPGMVQDHLPTIIVWIALSGFLIWMFIPQEMTALAERITNRFATKKRSPRH